VNSGYLEDQLVVDQLRDIWTHLPTTLEFFGKMHRLTKWYKVFSCKKAKDRRAHEIALRERVEVAHQRLQENPHDTHLQADLALVLDSLEQTEQWKLAGQRIRSRVCWRA
jgi:hypothetical protein